MLVGADQAQVAAVEIARRGIAQIQHLQRNAARTRGLDQRCGIDWLGAQPQQGEADAETVEQRIAGTAAAVHP